MKINLKLLVIARRAARRWLQLDNRKHLRRARSSHKFVTKLLEAQTRATVEARREAGWANCKVVDLEGYSRRLEDTKTRLMRERESFRRDLEGTYNRLVEAEELIDEYRQDRDYAVEKYKRLVNVLEDYQIQLEGLAESMSDSVECRRA